MLKQSSILQLDIVNRLIFRPVVRVIIRVTFSVATVKAKSYEKAQDLNNEHYHSDPEPDFDKMGVLVSLV